MDPIISSLVFVFFEDSLFRFISFIQIQWFYVLTEMVQIPFFFTVYSHWALNNIFLLIHFLFLAAEVQIVIIGSLELARNISQNILQNDSKYYTEGAFMLYIYELVFSSPLNFSVQ